MKGADVMTQCDRLREIIKSNNITQRKFAESLKVTESYVSMLLKDSSINISQQLLELIEEKYGYCAHWIVSGDDPKFSDNSKDVNLSETHRRLLSMIEQLTPEQCKAVLAFVNSLNEVERRLLLRYYPTTDYTLNFSQDSALKTEYMSQDTTKNNESFG